MRNYRCGKCGAEFRSKAEKKKHYRMCKKNV